ncbi:MAG TPA: PEP-CTERM sorting domain-containing protein [Pirellulales bacterium]|nr:PEP-CTERM sorting domain-containing protein [Pirellulales bacterium]
MIHTRLQLFRLAVCAFTVVILSYTQQASAEFFQFSTTITLSGISSTILSPPPILTGNGTDTVGLTTPGGTPFALTGLASVGPDNIDGSGGGTDIVFSNIGVTVGSTTPLEIVSFNYSLALRIDDFGNIASGGTSLGNDTFNIDGTLLESLGPGKKITLLSNSFTSPSSITKTINGQLYTVSVYRFLPPGAAFSGVWGLHVAPIAVPEPGTFVLVGSALALLAIPAFRRYRRNG